MTEYQHLTADKIKDLNLELEDVMLMYCQTLTYETNFENVPPVCTRGTRFTF